jgi:hypothetical protein
MALSFLQSPLHILDDQFPRFDLDCAMSDEAQIRSCTLTFERNLDLMIRDPLSQAFKADLHRISLITPHAMLGKTNRIVVSQIMSTGGVSPTPSSPAAIWRTIIWRPRRGRTSAGDWAASLKPELPMNAR